MSVTDTFQNDTRPGVVTAQLPRSYGSFYRVPGPAHLEAPALNSKHSDLQGLMFPQSSCESQDLKT